MPKTQRGMFVETWTDWFSFRRRFAYETEINPSAFARGLAALSVPPPTDANPLSVVTAVALSQAMHNGVLFEVDVARGLPAREGHYLPFQMTGRMSELEEGRWLVAGEIHPTWQGVVVYLFVVAGLLLWVVAAVTSAAVSPYGSIVAVWVALGTTGLLSAYMASLQWADMRRLQRLVKGLLEV